MATKSNDYAIADLLTMVDSGKAQLPDFQRSWVWDDERICKLIASISQGFPMGAAMFLETGGEVCFPCRPFEGTTDIKYTPDYLVLDGQQRLTTLFQVFKSQTPVLTCKSDNAKEKLKRHYYLDIRKCLDPTVERLDAIVSISDKKIQTEKIGRKIIHDLTTREREYEELMFPLNIAFSTNDVMKWMFGLSQHGGQTANDMFYEFNEKILDPIRKYELPVITVDRNTSKEAVCQIFENVNTGGMKLTVFELVTASFAADNFNLRDDWDAIAATFKKARTSDLLSSVEKTYFLTAMALLISYKRFRKKEKSEKCAVSCKKSDVLDIKLPDYKANRDALIIGFIKAANFLVNQGVFSSYDLPYTSQLIPLAAIFAYAEEEGVNLAIQTNKEVLVNWYWCGVFGEMYGGANETRYTTDIMGVFNQLEGGDKPDTVIRATFQPRRLLSMQTRNSAAYKGLMALILQDSPLDFMSADKMDIASYLDESTDIHHIFPANYCTQQGYDSQIWNSVINKTPIYASTNRSIGGRAPSEYIRTMANKGLTDRQMRDAISSHKVDYDMLVSDDFHGFIRDRAIRLLDRIERAMGKSISGRDSDDTVNAFGTPL